MSALPCASLASVWAVAGAIRYDVGVLDQREVRERRVLGQRVAREDAAQRVGSHSVTSTGAPVMPAKDAGPTKRVDASVCTTRTLWPAFRASRVNSSAL